MRPYAVFTVVRNEDVFLRLWCNYYCRLSPDVDAFVLDDSSSDSSVEDARARFPALKVLPVEQGGLYDLERLRKSVQSFQRSLLGEYEVVVYTDVDEFLLTADGEGLMSFLERFRRGGRPMARASGWHCVHKAGEPPLILAEGESVLKDRRRMQVLPRYDKVLISKVPSTWTNGFHGCVEAQGEPPDPNLALFHAWMIDRDLFLRKNRSYAVDGGARLLSGYASGLRPSERDIPECWKPLIRW